MSEPTKKFIVTSSQMVEVVRKWEVTVPDNENAEALAYDIAEDREPDEKFDFVCTEVETEWSIEEIDTPDQWGTSPDSAMWGVPPEGDPFWKENDQ